MDLLQHHTPLLKIFLGVATSGSNTALMLFVLDSFEVFFEQLLVLLIFLGFFIECHTVALRVFVDQYLVILCGFDSCINVFAGLSRQAGRCSILSFGRGTLNALLVALPLVREIFLDIEDGFNTLDLL